LNWHRQEVNPKGRRVGVDGGSKGDEISQEGNRKKRTGSVLPGQDVERITSRRGRPWRRANNHAVPVMRRVLGKVPPKRRGKGPVAGWPAKGKSPDHASWRERISNRSQPVMCFPSRPRGSYWAGASTGQKPNSEGKTRKTAIQHETGALRGTGKSALTRKRPKRGHNRMTTLDYCRMGRRRFQ